MSYNVIQILVFSGIFLLLAGTASAECLTFNQAIQLYGIANSLNISNTSFVNIFEEICQRSYDRNETDTKMEVFEDMLDVKMELVDEKIDGIDTEDIEERVDERMQNYTDWIDEKCSINLMLAAIYNTTNKTVDTSGLVSEEYVNDQLSGVNRDYDELIERVDNLTTRVNNKLKFSEMTGQATASPTSIGGFEWWVWVIVVAIILLVAQNFGRINLKKIASGSIEGKQRVIEQPKPIPGRQTSQEGPMDQQEMKDIQTLRAEALEEMKENKRHEDYMKAMQNEKDPVKREELLKDYEEGKPFKRASDIKAEGQAREKAESG